eukprot:SAG11_NODE_467_length_9212_cov_2.153627_4_plen_254_part_00
MPLGMNLLTCSGTSLSGLHQQQPSPQSKQHTNAICACSFLSRCPEAEEIFCRGVEHTVACDWQQIDSSAGRSEAAKPTASKNTLVRVRITRPLALGTDDDIHHLHIRQIEVFSSDGTKLYLQPSSGNATNPNGCVAGQGPDIAVDGDTESDAHTHSAFEPKDEKYGVEDLWLDYTIEGVASPAEIANVTIWNKTASQKRLEGCTVTLFLGSATYAYRTVEDKYVGIEEEDTYVFDDWQKMQHVSISADGSRAC